MNKGVVMEISPQFIIVMTPHGSFERVPGMNRNCQVGEEILYASRLSFFRHPAFTVLSVLVAAVVFCMVLFSSLPAVFADKAVVAYVSIDINPSIELGLDRKLKVREIRGLNDKGVELIRDVSFKGKALEKVAADLLQKAEEMSLLGSGGGADIIIASTIVTEEAKLDEAFATEELKQQVIAHVVENHPEEAESIEVTVFSVPAEVRASAEENGLSLGKYLVYLNAKNAGHNVKVEDLQKDSVHDIAAAAGGISKLIDSSMLDKDAIKELLQEEKDGTLDKKMQDKQTETDKQPEPSASEPASPTPQISSPSQQSSSSAGSAASTPSTSSGQGSNNGKDKDDKKNNSTKNGSSSKKNDDSKKDDDSNGDDHSQKNNQSNKNKKKDDEDKNDQNQESSGNKKRSGDKD